ncbi:MAG TPA: hypothetical protein VFL83_02145 [Anaeromyxobacter sp.]|nr:hypothetical protein [Anaeromyxobacter sp.]
MTPTRLPQQDPARAPGEDPGALVDWRGVRERAGFALRAVRRRPILAGTCFVAIAALGPLSLVATSKTYHVEAVVTASRAAVVSSLPDPVLLRSFDSEDPANAARDAILRRDALAALVEETGLVERWSAGRSALARARDGLSRLVDGREATRERQVEDLVDRLEKRLTVSLPGAQPGAPPGAAKDRIVVALDWSDGETARLLVETAARRFFEGRRRMEQATSRDALAVLEGRAADVRGQIEAEVARVREAELAMLRGNPAMTRTFRAPTGRTPQEAELAQLKGTLESRRLALAELERLREHRLTELRGQLARERITYAEGHPAIARTRELLERVSGPSPEAESLRTELARLDQEFQRASERAARLVDAEDPALEYRRTELRLLLAQYAALRDRIDGARVEGAMAQASFDRRYAFTVPPVVPRRAAWPIPALSLAASVLGGALLALFVAAALDVRSGTALEPWQLERRGLPVIGELRA